MKLISSIYLLIVIVLFFLCSSTKVIIPLFEIDKSKLFNQTKDFEQFILSNITVLNKSEALIKKVISYCIELDILPTLDEFLTGLKKLNNTNFQKVLNEVIKEKINELQQYQNEFSSLDSSNLKVVSPAFYWNDYYNSIELEILFTPTHGALGCSEIDKFFAVLYNRNLTFHFNANCTLGDDEIYFNLDLNVYKTIAQIMNVQITRGKATVILRKDQEEHWPSLLREGEEIPSNMKRKY